MVIQLGGRHPRQPRTARPGMVASVIREWRCPGRSCYCSVMAFLQDPRRPLQHVSASRALLPCSVLAACLLSLTTACGTEAEETPSVPDAPQAETGDSGPAVGGSESASSSLCSDQRTERRPEVSADNVSWEPWSGPDPQPGESCQPPQTLWRDGCRCGIRCECQARGWVCGALAC